MTIMTSFKALVAASMLVVVAGGAQAVTLVPMGNVTVNETGDFDSRTFMGSPAIAKVDWAVGNTGDIDLNSGWDLDGLFNVSFSNFGETDPDDDDPKTVTFSFDLSTVPFFTGSDDTLGIRYITLKTGRTDQGWRFVDALGETTAVSVFSGSLTVTGQAISHITFWDTGVPSPVPLPAAGFLLVGALGGLAALRRRRRTA